MSSYGNIFPLLRDPQGSNTGRCPHPRSPGRQEKPPAPLPERLSPPTRKGAATRLLRKLLDRFPAPSASVSFATPTEMERVKGDEVVHFTLDALNRPNTHRRGRWIGLPPAPAASQVRVGFGAKPQGLVFCF